MCRISCLVHNEQVIKSRFRPPDVHWAMLWWSKRYARKHEWSTGYYTSRSAIHCLHPLLRTSIKSCACEICNWNSWLPEFLSIIQTLYNFIANNNTRCMLFIQAQKRLEQTVLNLERTCNLLVVQGTAKNQVTLWDCISCAGGKLRDGLRINMQTYSFAVREKRKP